MRGEVWLFSPDGKALPGDRRVSPAGDEGVPPTLLSFTKDRAIVWRRGKPADEIVRLNDGVLRALATPDTYGDAALDPSGKRLAIIGGITAPPAMPTPGLAIFDVDADRTLWQTTELGDWPRDVHWTRDGRVIFKTLSMLFVLDVDTRQLRSYRLPPAARGRLVVSQDGHHVGFVGGDGKQAIWIAKMTDVAPSLPPNNR